MESFWVVTLLCMSLCLDSCKGRDIKRWRRNPPHPWIRPHAPDQSPPNRSPQFDSGNRPQQFGPVPQQFGPVPQQFGPVPQQFGPGPRDQPPRGQQFGPGPRDQPPRGQQFGPGPWDPSLDQSPPNRSPQFDQGNRGQQFGPGPRDHPRGQQFGPEPRDHPRDQQFGPEPRDHPRGQQFGPEPRDHPRGQQFGPEPRDHPPRGQQFDQGPKGHQPHQYDPSRRDPSPQFRPILPPPLLSPPLLSPDEEEPETPVPRQTEQKETSAPLTVSILPSIDNSVPVPSKNVPVSQNNEPPSPPKPPPPSRPQESEYSLEEIRPVQFRSHDLTLDDILQSERGQRIIIEEAERRLLIRMNRTIDQVGEEIVEALEQDALISQLGEANDLDNAGPRHSLTIISLTFIIIFLRFIFLYHLSTHFPAPVLLI